MSALPASTGEFGLIARHFQRPQALRHAALGIGDDCALLQPRPGEVLAISTDTLVSGRHFFADAAPATLGHKALALTLPAVDDAWLTTFAHGLFALADAHGCDLIGGDTTGGPLSITITVLGSVPKQQALLRSGAQVGDDIYISHAPNTGLGDARLALHLLQAQRGDAPAAAIQHFAPTEQAALLHTLRPRLETPTPRVALGLALRGVASSCMDVSDGLQGDLRHILKASNVGATLHATHADGSGLLAATSPAVHSLGTDIACEYALAGGDDYELLFTAGPQQHAAIQAIARQTGLVLTRIGKIESSPGLRLRKEDGGTVALAGEGFDHFGG